MTPGTALTRQANELNAMDTTPTVLGSGPIAIPTSGRIRAGVKVLTATFKSNPEAVEIYDSGVAAGHSWDQIERAVRDATHATKRPLTPKNVPYFSVRGSDFALASTADQIMEMYAEDRGDGRHLYTFPIVFPVDTWQAVMPHRLAVHSRNEVLFWSQYGADGVRYCKTYGQVEVDPRNRRAVRTFGGRPIILRPDTDGVCNPERCPQYQDRTCNLTGGFVFYVPGIQGAAAIKLPTTSFYSLQQARQKLAIVQATCGKISGLFNGEPIFWMTKRREEVSMIDPQTGKPRRVKQWLIELDAKIDMAEIFRSVDRPELESRGRAASKLLAGPQASDEEETEFVLPGTTQTSAGQDGADESTASVDGEANSPACTPAKEQSDEPDPEPSEPPSLKDQIFRLLEVLDIDSGQFSLWGEVTFGDGWKQRKSNVESALATLEKAQTDGSIVDSIRNSLPF